MENNLYGNNKRLKFLRKAIEQERPVKILDLGCGTGELLTSVLAAEYPQVQFMGIDSDVTSINYADSKNQLSNLQFITDDVFFSTKSDQHFDMVIASEVIEHVDDPVDFLSSIHNLLNENGSCVLTMPNGYGPFEFLQLIESLLVKLKIQPFLVRIKRIIMRMPLDVDKKNVDTLALSPHVNFFSLGGIKKLIKNAHFETLDFRSKIFLSGFGVDHLYVFFNKAWIASFNERIVDFLPARLASGWMFHLKKKQIVGAAPLKAYKRSMYAKFRMNLNLTRWGLK